MSDKASKFKVITKAIPSANSIQVIPSVERPIVGVRVKADKANVGVIYIGDSRVTTSGDTAGYPLDKAEVIFMALDNLDSLYAIAASDADKLHVLIT